EVRVNCGGCHAHSQQPTPFEQTRAGRAESLAWDLTTSTPLIVDRARDESKRQWDEKSETGLRIVKSGPLNVEYRRDIQPILQRGGVMCHRSREGREPAGKLDLDADGELVQVENQGKLPGTYVRLALDQRAQFGIKPVGWTSWGNPNASRYVRKFQSR